MPLPASGDHGDRSVAQLAFGVLTRASADVGCRPLPADKAAHGRVAVRCGTKVSAAVSTVLGMTPIYNPRGHVCAWFRDDKIYDLRGRCVGFIRQGRQVINTRGRHLGVLDDGNFRDHMGNAAGWIRGGSGGPVRPVPSVPPVPPVPSVPPVPPVTPVPPVPAVPSLSWSALDWSAFVSGG